MDIGKYWNMLIDFIYSCVLSIGEMIKDIAIWIFEAIFSLAVVVLDSFSASFDALDVTQYISGLPSEVMQVLALLGINTASQMIISAILIRLGLQLIPFVRLGS